MEQINLNEVFPECVCKNKNWKQEGVKIICGSCGFVLFKGFPSHYQDGTKIDYHKLLEG